MSVDSSEQCGHLFLMRIREGAEKACFNTIRKRFINLQRKKYYNFDIAAGTSTSIPDKATAIAWCDGDLSQIDTNKQSVELFAKTRPLQTSRMPLNPVLSSQPILHLYSNHQKDSTHTHG